MLRPKQMSKVSVTGSRAVLRDAIEAIHELRLMHFADYDGTIEGFDSGDPLDGADGAADKLVTVRSLQSILGVRDEDAGPTRIVTEAAIEDELEPLRVAVNELDDRRSAIEDDLDTVEERIDGAEPFVELGYDLELLSGYDHLEVAVGEGSIDDVVAALDDREDVEEYDVETAEDVLAIFVHPTTTDGGVLDDALVGIEFERFEIPDASGEPEAYVEGLEHERQKLASKLQSVESELEDYRLEHAAFLLAAEEKLTIEVQKAEIPLQFATTEHAFVAEGWIPTADVDALRSAVNAATDDRVEIEELEVAGYRDYERVGHGHDEAETAADGGAVFDRDDEPPVIQDNPGVVKPFEVLVQVINRPRYSELDPTIVLFLTMPAFFGFMIGDIGYGALYVVMSYWLTKRFGGALKRLGQVGLWLGGFTVVFGLLYAELFGYHLPYTPIIHRGLEPSLVEWARLWLVISLLIALVHLTVGYLFDFHRLLSHSLKEAFMESGSLIMVMLGVWLWVFAKPLSVKPPFIFEVFAGNPIPLGFTGFPPIVGTIGLAFIPIGLVAAFLGGGAIEAYEGLMYSLTHVLSYTRLAAEALAEGGIAFVINLLFFGGYAYEGEFHYLTGQTAQQALQHNPDISVTFSGLMHMGIVGVLGGILVLIFGHLMVLALGITSAGMQAIRLQYVEFFGKFYNGGGANYEPFGYDRSYTTQD